MIASPGWLRSPLPATRFIALECLVCTIKQLALKGKKPMNISNAPEPLAVSLYVAFSIHGTNAFITALKSVNAPNLQKELAKLAEHGLTPIPSRRPEFNHNTEVKLRWGMLNTVAGKPLRSPPAVLNRMRKLRGLGFIINEEAFINKHLRPNHGENHAVPR